VVGQRPDADHFHSVAIVSGIALCVFNYQVLMWVRRRTTDIRCLDVMGMFLFYALVVDAGVEALDWIHRVYSAEEGFQMMHQMANEKLFYTLNLGQALLGTLVPALLLGTLQLLRRHIPELARRRIYFASAVLILVGVLAMRWNVVIGGQLFSKSLRGVMSYKMEFAGMEGWFMGAFLLMLPLVILTVYPPCLPSPPGRKTGLPTPAPPPVWRPKPARRNPAAVSTADKTRPEDRLRYWSPAEGFSGVLGILPASAIC
jgi:hypothetical protein